MSDLALLPDSDAATPEPVSIVTYDDTDRAVGLLRGEPAQVVALLAFQLGQRPGLTWRALPEAYASITDVGEAGQHVPALADLPAPAAAPR